MIISASCGIEPNRIVEYKPNVDEAIRLSGLEVKSLVLQREESPAPLNPNDLVWQVSESVYNHHGRSGGGEGATGLRPPLCDILLRLSQKQLILFLCFRISSDFLNTCY